MIAESTGKGGTGIVPVDGEPLGPPPVTVRTGSSCASPWRRPRPMRRCDALAAPSDPSRRRAPGLGHPIIEDRHALAAEFVRFEVATAASAAILGVNPFDEPNVSESKANTEQALARFVAGRPLTEDAALVREGGLAVFAPGPAGSLLRPVAAAGEGHGDALARVLAAHVDALAAPDLWALLVYGDLAPAESALVARLRRAVRDRARVATTLGIGPRYLHSTGQLHKGGPARAAFLVLTFETRVDLPVPERAWSFGVLCDAQAAGDVEALATRGLRVLRIHLEGPREAALATLLAPVENRAASGTVA